MLVNNLSLAVEDKGMGNIGYTHGTAQVAVGIEVKVEFPPPCIYHRPYVVYGFCIIYGNGNEFYTGFLLPIVVQIGNGR